MALDTYIICIINPGIPYKVSCKQFYSCLNLFMQHSEVVIVTTFCSWCSCLETSPSFQYDFKASKGNTT